MSPLSPIRPEVAHLMDLHPEVAAALASGRPVVALESTIISHGMPHPQNVEMARGVEAVVREGVSNAVRHAAATDVVVTVSVGDDLVVDVSDDGRGMPEAAALSGLLNLERRARSYGGELDVSPRDPEPGTRLVWRVPLPSDAAPAH